MDRGIYACGLFVAVLPFASRVAWRIWKGEGSDLRSFSDRYMREAPLMIALSWPFFGLGLLLFVTHGTARALIALGWVITLIAMLVLVPSVRYLGRPRALIPPHLRGPVRREEPPMLRDMPVVRDPTDRERELDRSPVEPRQDAARTFYRDPWAVVSRVGAAFIFLGVFAYTYLTGITDIWTTAGLVALLVFLWVGVLRAGVRADAEGVTVRTDMRRVERVAWSEIDHFELDFYDDGLPHAFARLKDGDILELEPIQGVQMQPKKRRRDWAAQALAGLSAQLRVASHRR